MRQSTLTPTNQTNKPHTMKFEITNRWTGDTQITANIECSETASRSLKLGLAVQWALNTDANLTGANLRSANLTDANLTDANLTGANLTGANLTGADLRSANLTGADLTDADLTDADLRSANLTGADLRSANLTDADLRSANLTDANLTGADLTDADLTDADLTGANLRSADLTDADLTDVRADMLAEILKLPNELDFLRDALVAGKVDGSTYSGACACLAGTLAHACGNLEYTGGSIGNFQADAQSPRERFFLAIRKGDTPETNQCSKIALGWVDEAIAIRDHIRATAPTNQTKPTNHTP